MARIFVSYRREDTPGHTGRLYDHLVAHLGQRMVFRDMEGIDLGTDFVRAIEKAIASCDVLLAVIGPQWLNARDPHGRRRLDDPKDFVRLELATALARGVRLIPVLVGDARMPSEEELPHDLAPLARRNAVEITDRRFRSDVEQLARSLGSLNTTVSHETVLVLALIALFLIVVWRFQTESGFSPEVTGDMTGPPYPQVTPAVRKELESTGPSRGPDDAPVTLVEVSDFMSPDSARLHLTLEKVLKEYPGKVRRVFRLYPQDYYAQAFKAAEAALCAHDQGRFWDYHDTLFTHQPALEVPQLKEYAKEVCLDAAKFNQCLDSGQNVATVKADMEAGKEADILGVPTVFINGHELPPSTSFEDLKRAIDAELSARSSR